MIQSRYPILICEKSFSCRSVSGYQNNPKIEVMINLNVKDQVILLESLLKEKRDELKKLEALDEEKDRLFANIVSMGMTVDEAIEVLQRNQSK